MRWLRRSDFEAVVLALLLVSATHGLAQGVFESIGREVNQVLEKTKPAVVRVKAEEGGIILCGTGFFIDDKGYLLTAANYIPPVGGQITVEYKDQLLTAELVGFDNRSGVAMLHVAAGVTPFLSFGHSSELEPASAVITVGYPFNLPAAANFGLISTFDTQYLEHFFPTTHIRANVPISAGQVGGPLLNPRGEVVGLIVFAVEEGKSVYSLPSDAVQKVVGDFRKFGRARHGWVGVGFTEAPADQENEHRVKISQLFTATPASSSGLRAGDLVLKIGQRDIYRPGDAMDASFFSEVGEELPVTVERDGKEITFKFVVTERPKAMPVPIPLIPEVAPTTGLPLAVPVKAAN